MASQESRLILDYLSRSRQTVCFRFKNKGLLLNLILGTDEDYKF